MVTDSEGSEAGDGVLGGGRGERSSSENEYEMGSFVVQDDEDLGFDEGE
jgi:hypothetical protein